jgi:hypothetical protein
VCDGSIAGANQEEAVKKLLLFSLFASLTFFTFTANAANLYFYGGDFDNNNALAHGLANETDGTVQGSPYGAATFQNFVVSDSQINVTGLFTNDIMDLNPPPATAYWEIRSGVSEGNGGTLLASGTGTDMLTATGRERNGRLEYTNLVQGLSVNLAAGTYWFAVVPESPTDPVGRSFNTNSLEGLNAVGTQISNQQYFDSAFFGATFTNANNEIADAFPTFSSGVYADVVPEPSTFLMLGSGLLGVAGVVRRRMSR